MASLNIKGRRSGDIDKWLHIPQLMRDNGIGILAIQETHLTEELANQFQNLFGNTLSLHYSPDPTTRNARGIAIVVRRQAINTNDISVHTIVPGRAMIAKIPWHDNQEINILVVYAPNPLRENQEFWGKIKTSVETLPNLRPDIMLGDFNLVEDALDRLPSKQDGENATDALRELRSELNLIDGWRHANPHTKGYTWVRECDGTQSRIDRIYVREEFLADCKDWEITQPPIPTDHEIVSAKITTPTTPEIGRGRWAIPPRLLKNKYIKGEIQKLGMKLEDKIAARPPRTETNNPQIWLQEFKSKALNIIRTYEKKTQPKIKVKIAKLHEDLNNIRNNHALPIDEIKIASTQIKKEIQTLVKETHQYKRNVTTAVDAAEGEIIGKTWSRRAKECKPRDTIKSLKDQSTNSTTRNSQRMTQIAAKHHEEIQSKDGDPHEPPDDNKMNEILENINAKISDESKRKLSENISPDEIREAIRRTSNDKAPGLDGIPIELWKSMDDQFKSSTSDQPDKRKCDIVQVLTTVFLDIETHGTVASARINEGCISPIYKKKDPEDIANYRPITLLNTDYKIFTKALSLRLADVAPQIINRDQAGFIPGRSIFDQVKTTKLVIDYMNISNKKGVIVALDQEKAYDKVRHPYLWAVMKKFEFPEKFIKLIQNLYDNALTTVMINGEMSIPFIVSRGVRQGDAMSCLLFNIAIEPLAEMIRKSTLIKGLQIPASKSRLKVKMFVDDTTVFLEEADDIRDLQDILSQWCESSRSKLNIEKTEVIPLGNSAQRRETLNERKTNESGMEIPSHIHIAKDGEPVRILGAWLGNNIDQNITWAPVIENCCKRLKRWGAAKHTLEGRRLIIQMQIAGVTQYLTKVQGMPKSVEDTLDKATRRFLWNNERTDTVNRKQMHASHKKGGKKVLNLEARNKAIHLTWLKAYLNMGKDRATWTYFADAIIGNDIPDSQQIDRDPESRVMPILQTWQTKAKKSNLPIDLRTMLDLARKFNVQVATTNPSMEAKLDLPIWYHVRSARSTRKLYKTKHAKCLRNKHSVRLTRDVALLINSLSDEHTPTRNCKCNTCKNMRTTEKCTHPFECLNLAATLLKKIHPKWNPLVDQTDTQAAQPNDEQRTPEETTLIKRDNEATHLKESITIFGSKSQATPDTPRTAPRTTNVPNRPLTVYTDGACIKNGEEDASAGLGVWYGDDDSRNLSMKVPIQEQSNQTGELLAVLMAVKNHPPNEDLEIISDSRYVIDGLTKNRERWEARNWTDTHHGDIFKCITAWTRWRNGRTNIAWIKGHSGVKGNEEADRLAGEGASLTTSDPTFSLEYPQDLITPGARISELEQKDFYKIINEKGETPRRSRTDRNIEIIKACSKETHGTNPTSEKIWLATKHRDLSRKTRDFLWKATQNAYKIGEFWIPITGYEERGTCPLCNELEDMDHILTKCKSTNRSTAWNLANEVWRKRHTSPLPDNLGDILGCGLANFQTDNKPNRGKNRLYRILMSETAYLVWKTRNERRIRDSDNMITPDETTAKRWINSINKRLTIDRFLTDKKRFGKKAMCEKLVKATWSACLKNEELLPANWPSQKGVLVGISVRCLRDTGDEI